MEVTLTKTETRRLIRLYTQPNENNAYRALSEVAEIVGISPYVARRILTENGVKVTRGRQRTVQGMVEYRGQHRGRCERLLLTVAKLRKKRLSLGLTSANISKAIGQYHNWVINMERNLLRATPERLQAYDDGLTICTTGSAKLRKQLRAKYKGKQWTSRKPRKTYAGRPVNLDTGNKIATALRIPSRQGARPETLKRALDKLTHAEVRAILEAGARRKR